MKLKNEEILDVQIKEFIENEHPVNYTYADLQRIEKILSVYIGHQPAPFIKDTINGRTFEIRLDCKSSFGSINEELLGKYCKETYPELTRLFPNGKMDFPDMRFNNINIDFKAVLCTRYKDGCDLISPTYSSTLGCIENMSELCLQYFKNRDEDNHMTSELASSLIALTFYSVDDNDVATIEYIKLVPIIFYIGVRKDLTNFSTKRGGQDLNCTGNLRICPGKYTVYIDKIKQVLINKNII